MIETPSSLIMVLDGKGEIVEFNQVAADFFDVNKNQAIGKNYFDDLATPDKRKVFIEEFKNILSGEPLVGYSDSMPSGEGFRIVEWNAHAFTDDNGRTEVIVVGFDVTDKMKIQKKLIENEERYRKLAETSEDHIFILDKDIRFTYMNQVGAKKLGLSQDEYTGKKAEELFPPMVAEQMKNHTLLAFRTGEMVIDESEIPFNDKKVYLDTRLLPLKDNQGEVREVMGVARDYSSMKMAEEALRESEEKYRTLSESSPDDIFLIDMNGNIQYMNPMGLKRLEKELIDVEGKNLALFAPAKAVKQMMSHVERVLKTGKTERYEDVIDVGKGKFYHDTMLNPIFDETGNISSILAVSRDVTLQIRSKQLSESLNVINSLLSASLDRKELINIGITEGSSAIGAQASIAFLKHDLKWVVEDVSGEEFRGLLGEVFKESELPTISRIVQSREVVSIRDNIETDSLLSYVENSCGLCDVIAVPLIIKNKITGVILFLNIDASNTFSEIDIDFVKKLAVSVSLSLENAKLYSEERNIADTLQESQLILPDQIEKIDIGHIYISATKGAQVGGDFYDVFELDHDRIGILIGDVSGKGLYAANLTNHVKNTIRAYSYENSSPADIVSRTNRAVIKNTDELTFITLAFGILEKSTGIYKYCNAGHPPVILRGSDSVKMLKSNSSAVGIYDDLLYVDDKITLKEFETLILYTDGLIEARINSKFFGDERLINAIRSSPEVSSSDLPQYIYGIANKFSKGDLSDDLAMLTIEYKPEKVLRLAS